MHFRPLALFLLASVVALAAHARPALADQIVLQPVKDITLIEEPQGLLSNATGPRIYVGRNSIGGRRRALIAFDLSAIPPGSTITDATLTLYMSRTQAGDNAVELHRALADWGEGTSYSGGTGGGSGAPSTPNDATWIHRFYPDVLWANPGGDFDPTPSATTIVRDIGSYTWSGPGVVADVQAWVNAPGANFGWLLIGDEVSTPSAKRFESREGQSNQRPRLTIQYTPPSGPLGACCLGDSCLVLTPAQCAAMGGTYQGDATTCSPSPCAVPVGACCLPSGECVELSAADCAASGGTYRGDGEPCASDTCSPVLEPFVDPLPIPAVAQPVSGAPGGEATYIITMTEFEQQLHRDLPPTRVWGYNGTYPGPTIEASRGRPVTVTWVNDLRDEQGNLRTDHYLPVDACMHGPDHFGSAPRTVVHLHGGKVPAHSDGHPDDAFPPGEQSEPYVYPNNQPPATLWYHDHGMGITRLNVYMGLAGFYLLRDEAEAALNLPSGEFEVPLVIQDRSFNPDGSLRYPDAWHEHFFGDFILVNGKVWPYLEVRRGKYRFRIINGSNSRTYTLALSNGQPFQQIGTDGGLLPSPVTLSSVTLAPAERADLIIDFAPLPAGTEVILTNSAPAPFPGDPGVGVIPDVMKFIVTDAPGHTGPIPASLTTIEPLSPLDAAAKRDFILQQSPEPCAGSAWLINGLLWDDITEFPRLNSTEVWSFINRSGITHPMHMHLVQFQILERQPFEVVGGQILPVGDPIPPDPNELGWKDTVRVGPFEIARVIARFEDYTGLFPYHCHILEHEDHEMMRQFRTTCAADWDANLAVNSNDISAFLTAWLASLQAGDLIADVNNDGHVNSNDISAFLTSWLDSIAGGC